MLPALVFAAFMLLGLLALVGVCALERQLTREGW